MKRPGRKNSQSLAILALNILLLVSAVALFGRYVSVYQERLREENLGNIANLNRSAATNATAMIGSWAIKLDDVARYVRRHDLTHAETLVLLDDANSSESRQFELIGADYTGYLARRDESGAFIPLSYGGSAYASLQEAIDDYRDESEDQIRFAPEFTDGYTAQKYFAVYVHLPLRDEAGKTSPYALLLAGRARDVLGVFNNQEGFTGLSNVLVDAQGNYIISNNDFKSVNFFQYLYVYNDLSLDQKSEITRKVLASDSGELYYQNAMGQDCVFRYSRMETNGWYCITCVPIASFRVPVFNINYALYAVVALLLMLALDIFWLRGMNRRLQYSIQREKVASEAKTDFLSRMSHDIRTPLNGIIGLTYLAMDEPNPPKTADYLDNIKASGNFLLGLVNDILDMSRVESGKMELRPERYTCGEFCKYIRAVIGPLCKEKRLEFRLTPPEERPSVMVDRLRLNQIFFNLLSNSVKYTPTGGLVELFWSAQPLPNGRVALDFTVRDDGIGMSEEFQTRMFESFSQEHAEMAASGSGLGLAIVWKLVQLMGGRVSATSKLGEGTSFFVHLEMAVCAEAEAPVVAASGQELTGRRVLLCEDNQINTLIAKRLLEKWGMTVDAAENGRVGLELFSASNPGDYDAILMDIRMPELNGYEATRAIRALDRPDAVAIPIIAMTANAYDTDVKNCLDAGMNAHLGKPIQPELLREQLIEYMR